MEAFEIWYQAVVRNMPNLTLVALGALGIVVLVATLVFLALRDAAKTICAVALTVAGFLSADAQACTPGATHSCTGIHGCHGSQECVDTSPPTWAPCECEPEDPGDPHDHVYNAPEWTMHTQVSAIENVQFASIAPSSALGRWMTAHLGEGWENYCGIGFGFGVSGRFHFGPYCDLTFAQIEAIAAEAFTAAWTNFERDYWDAMVVWGALHGCVPGGPGGADSCSPHMPDFPGQWQY